MTKGSAMGIVPATWAVGVATLLAIDVSKTPKEISMKNMWIVALGCAAITLIGVSNAEAKECTYSLDSKDVKMQWTAFKTTEKLGVKGTFTKVSVKGATSAGSLGQLAKGLSMELDGASVESGNAGRNVTIKQFFFEKFAPSLGIKASVAKLEGDDTKGTIHISLSLNGVSKTLPFAYTVQSGVLEAKASMTMSDFALKTAFDSLHNACGTLHTGKDGVPKTWEDVDLVVSSKFSKVCK